MKKQNRNLSRFDLTCQISSLEEITKDNSRLDSHHDKKITKFIDEKRAKCVIDNCQYQYRRVIIHLFNRNLILEDRQCF